MAKTWPWDTEGFKLANLKDVDLTGLQEGQTIILSNGTFIPGTVGIFSGLAKITVGTTEPTTPAVGDLWIDTN